MMLVDKEAAEVFESLSVATTNDEILSILKTIHLLSANSSDIRLIHAEAYAYILLDQPQKAISLLSKDNSRLENYPYTWILLGLSYRKLGGCDNHALRSYRKADQLSPDRPDILYNIANILFDLGDVSAFHYFHRSLSLNPLQANAWHNLHLFLSDQACSSFASTALKISLLLDPSNPEAWCNRGLEYIQMVQPLKAKKAFELALSLDPSHPSSSTNIGNLLVDSSQPYRALSYLSTGLGTDPSSLLNLGLCHLLLANFDEGWTAYESRLSSFALPIESARLSNLSQIKPFDDELVVWSEQGIGDSIMFVRYLLLLDARNISWHFYCPNSLLPLFKNCFNFRGQFSSIDELPSSSRSFNIPLLSLPKLFKTDLSSIPSFCPYIRLNCSVLAELLIPPAPGAISIGIVWATDPANAKMYKYKSVELKLLMSCLQPLIDLGLVRLHSLQVGDDAQQLLPWSQHNYVFDWQSKLIDFNVTAQLISQMDLVISVDTAVSHLAGSMNIPTWLMLPANADFRWLLERNYSPWYPSVMRLFRQSVPGDWASVITQISDSLDSLFHLDLKLLASSKNL